MNRKNEERISVAVVLFLLFITNIDDLLGVAFPLEIRLFMALSAVLVGLVILLLQFIRKRQ
ncbi:MAG: hypothetical protein ACFFEF_18515 [Candidatus Thorarchaeota archaeon]